MLFRARRAMVARARMHYLLSRGLPWCLSACGRSHRHCSLAGRLADRSACHGCAQMTRMLDILEDYARLRGYEYCRIDGSTSGEV